MFVCLFSEKKITSTSSKAAIPKCFSATSKAYNKKKKKKENKKET